MSRVKMVQLKNTVLKSRQKKSKRAIPGTEKRAIRKKKKVGFTNEDTKKMKQLSAVILILILIIISVFSVQFFLKPKREDWTIMLYMAGDNSLSPYIDENLQTMMKIGSGKNLDIIALADKSGDSDSQLFHVEKGRLKQLPITQVYISGLNEVDTGNPLTLSSFGNFVIDHYPSDHYLLIMWGHGQGWQGLASDKAGSILTMKEFREALKIIIETNNETKLDVIGFDACAMGTIEGFYEVSDYADILVASQKKEPDSGWPYEQILKGITSGKYDTPENLAQGIVDEYVNAYQSGNLPSQGFTVGMTAVKTSKNNELYVAFQRFSYAIWNLPIEDRNKIKDVRNEIESYENKDNVDISDLLVTIPMDQISNQQLLLSVQNLQAALHDVILKEKHWNNPTSSIEINRGGLCIYWSMITQDPNYRDTILAQYTNWDEVISS